MRHFILLVAVIGLSGCGALPFGEDRASVYDLQREALLAYDNDENAKAENLMQALLRVSPNDPLTLFYLGNLYARTGRPDQAIDAYQKSLMINGADPRPWHNLGVIRLRQAHAAFIQAFDLSNPGDPLHDKLDTVIRAMGEIPLDAMRERPPKPARP